MSGQAAKHDFTAAAMDGSTVDTASLRGKVIVLNLWFINCPNCIQEIKLLNQLAAEYAGNKEVVFLAPAASSKAELVKFLAKNPFDYTVIPDAASIILGRFGTPGKNGEVDMPFPMHVVLDRTGKMIVQVQGTKGIDAVRKELADLFGAKTKPAN
jgi:peroxiredoxin